jgi:glycosyltransferase involved in cell wall biosynthesis
MSKWKSEKLAAAQRRVSVYVRTSKKPVQVLLMDLLPTVPYYTGHLCAALKQMRGFHVTLVAARYRHDPEFFERMGLQHDVGLVNISSWGPNNATTFRRALKLFECLINLAALGLRFSISKPDVIHIQFTPLAEHGLPFELWLLKVAHGLGIRLVYTVHNLSPHDSHNRLVPVYRELYQLIDRFICHDDVAKARFISEFKVHPDSVSVIPHGPLFGRNERTTPYEARVKVGLPADACVVLWQGIARPYKGLSFLLKVWKVARQAGLQGILSIVGAGDKQLLQDIRQEAESLGLGSTVRFDFRFVSVEELRSYHEAADILVYPYREITTSGALMTGIGFEKAILASALPAFEQVLQHGKNALLVPYGDIEGWASALLQLASNPDLRARLARKLTTTGPVGSCWTEIAHQTCRVYEQLVPAA